MSNSAEFNAYRSQMNQKILEDGDKVIKRIYSLDAFAYQEGEIDVKTKELIGLTCSLVLRCDDCVKYHLVGCVQSGLSKKAIREAMSIAVLIGGTIVIPHLRRAVDYLEGLKKETVT